MAVHSTIFTVEVISDGPYHVEDLSQIAYDIDEGDHIGTVSRVSSRVIRKKSVLSNLLRIGNDGSWMEMLGLGDEGEDDGDDGGI
jgi:hypothetical protein